MSVLPPADVSKALLSAVVVQATSDLCLPLTEDERREEYNIVPEARTALAFFFHPQGALAHYCGWLDVNPDAIRRHLITQMNCPLSKWTVSPFGYRKERFIRAQQRNMRARLQWYLDELEAGCAPTPEQEHRYEQGPVPLSARLSRWQ